LNPAAAKRATRDADTFSEVASLYLEKYAKLNKRTWARDEWIINRELLPHWRNCKAAELTRKDVIALLDGIVERGTPVHANHPKALISKLFNFAIRRGIVDANPTHGVGNPGEEKKQRDRVLSEEEIRTLWGVVDREPAHIAAIIRLALLTAQRRGESLGMRWGELDLDAGWWTIPADRAKNGLAHRVPLAPQAAHLLRQVKAQATDENLVFRDGRIGQPIANLQKPLRGAESGT
jgi:integrase